MKIKVVALHAHEWAKTPHQPHDRYEADTEDPRFDALLKLGLAKVVEEEYVTAPVPRAEYRRRDMKAGR
jgi:hypothetical protein